MSKTLIEEQAEGLSADDALEYLRNTEQFEVILALLRYRKTELEVGLGSATADTALRQCGQLSENAYILDMFGG
jgi:hypothetical protein